MWTAIKGMFSSKKFWMTIIGTVLVVVLQQLGVGAEIIAAVAGLFGVAVAGQGLADFGKNAK